MKQSSLTIFFAALMTALFSACSDDFGSKDIPQEELYTRAFIKEFGIFDMAHTWNLATEGTITVRPSSYINDCRVYARYDGDYYYVARAVNASRSFTLAFDVPTGVTDLKLVIDGTTYYAQVGTSITVGGGSRAIWESTNTSTNPAGTIQFTKTGYAYFTPEDILYYTNRLPEIGSHQDYNNLGKVTQNFFFLSNGSFTVYPVYWNTTRSENTLCIYTRYYDEDGIAHTTLYPFYINNNNDKELQYTEVTAPANNDWSTIEDSSWKNCSYSSGIAGTANMTKDTNTGEYTHSATQYRAKV